VSLDNYTLAETAELALEGPEQAQWFAQLEAEHGNVRAALAWTGASDQFDLALRIGGSLGYFWHIHSHLRRMA
jgi:hypothetical protein